jgi:hypothetical protein
MPLEFRGAQGECTTNPNKEFLRSVILDHDDNYWRNALTSTLSFHIAEPPVERTLLVSTHSEHGVYLKYHEQISGKITKTLLSLGDAATLDAVVDTGDEWYASVGLFLPPQTAWEAILEYCTTGTLSGKVHWIDPSAIPETGNW